MKIEHIKASRLTTNNWSGGTTTQLAIYPKDADYKKQNFLFRISSATVETEESSFTKLSGVSRKIMILDGEIRIEHQNHYTKVLKRFEQDKFEGNWDTKSYGKATDFNLMTTGNTKGEIESITFTGSQNLKIQRNIDCFVLYTYNGEVKLSIDNKNFEIYSGDILLLSPEKNDVELRMITSKKCEIIISKITL